VQQTEARQQKKQKRKVEEGKLHMKRQAMGKAKVNSFPIVAFYAHLSPSKECCNIKRIKRAWKGAEREVIQARILILKSFGGTVLHV
jgi:hypothetical protein